MKVKNPIKIKQMNNITSVFVSSDVVFSFIHSFLVACTRLCNPLCPLVGRSVGWSVTLYFFYDFYFWTSLLLPKWSSDLKYGPCPPARDFGSRVSGLVFFKKGSHSKIQQSV